MVKEKQKNSPTQVPTKELKTKNKAGAKAGTKVPRNEVGPGAAHKTLPRVALESFSGMQLPTSLVALIKTLERKRLALYSNKCAPLCALKECMKVMHVKRFYKSNPVLNILKQIP